MFAALTTWFRRTYFLNLKKIYMYKGCHDNVWCMICYGQWVILLHYLFTQNTAHGAFPATMKCNEQKMK